MSASGGIPAIPIYKAVRQYAFFRGLRFFTWKDVEIATRLYLEHAKINN